MKKFYICNHCGNIFGVIKDAGVTPICCGEPMPELVANTTDAAQEKHVPVIERNGTQVTVKVGSVAHPMQDDHYIGWIVLSQGSLTQRKSLNPGEAPEATFTVPDAAAPLVAYEYCNLHGLWKAEA
ncbi:MAG: desulfoferrodoxin [Clostridiales Family XIII bacterium]|jgi:superoxide reductase|nr:desulfoferrodoxin [Clostridiales Family XIII bacterium]